MSRRRRRRSKKGGGLRLVVLQPGAASSELEIGRLLYPEKVARPRTRSQCEQGVRPCPFVGCRFNLFLELGRERGTIFERRSTEPWDVPPQHSCALDLADHGGMSHEEIAIVLQVSKQRVQQLEARALAKAGQHPLFPEIARLFFGRLVGAAGPWQDEAEGDDRRDWHPGRARKAERTRARANARASRRARRRRAEREQALSTG